MIQGVDITDVLGNRTAGVLSVPDGARSVVILSHGFTTTRDARIYKEFEKEFNAANVGTLRYDFYGHGPEYGFELGASGVSADITIPKAVASLNAMIAYVRGTGDFKIGLFGSSFGGLLSLIAASQDEGISAMALRSPVTEPKRFWEQRIKEAFGKEGMENWRTAGIIHYKGRSEEYDLEYEFWRSAQRYETLRAAKNIRCPTVIVHGDKDTTVPIEQSRLLANALKIGVHVMKGADHSYSGPGHHEAVKKLMREFLIGALAEK